jgi:hypothetical protein
MKSKSNLNLSKKNISNYITIGVGLIIIVLLAIILYKINKKDGFKTTKLMHSLIKTDTPITGYWLWTWGGDGGSEPPNMCDIGIRFGGEVPKTAIDNNIDKANTLTKCREKYLDLGGGLQTGIWNISDFDYINSQLNNIKSKGWNGICFDIEVCPPGVSFVKQFADCFAKCKAAGLKVLVTMSHLVPYSCQTGSGQGMDLVNEWIQDSNIDYISPQLYSEGHTLEPSDLSLLKNAKAKIIPSVPRDSDWPNIQNLGISPAGYLTWIRSNLPTSINYCGKDWNDVVANCATAKQCPGGTNGECPASAPTCFANVPCGGGGGGGGNKVNLCGTNWDTVDCAKSVRCPGAKDGECPPGQKCWGNNPC